jgi:23S rRNA (cytosine1962-C5)-methyltransferase
MDKTAYQSELFSNRLKRKYKELRKTMRKNRVLCYRLYDRDIPEVPLSLDLYEFLPGEIDTQIEAARFIAEQNARISANDPAVENDIKERTYAVLYLYERPYEKSDEEEAVWLDAMANAAAQVLGIQKEHIVIKTRGHKSHKSEGSLSLSKGQYQKNESTRGPFDRLRDREGIGLSIEQGQLFKLDLTSYLVTGLFFDHRTLRSTVRDTCSKKRVLNLFCYTGSFSVYAAQGNARYVESVDLSNTYLAWAKDNMKLNGFDDRSRYMYTRADCMRFLQEKAVAAKSGDLKPQELYDLIILDPPTFSNSKATTDVLDINRDWPQLVKDCLNILAPGGTLYFSTNSERIKFDDKKIPPKTAGGLSYTCTDITSQTIPVDFTGKRPHKVWKFVTCSLL